MFADVSMKAYGAVAYLYEGQQSSLVMARTRVAPLKTKTLPRLEIMAAVIGARLAQFVKSSLTPLCTDISTFLWSDSQIVFHWLNSHKKLKQFITSRVQEITKSFPLQCGIIPQQQTILLICSQGGSVQQHLKSLHYEDMVQLG